MRIAGFTWLEDVAEKLWQKHSVSQREVEEVFGNSPYYRYVQKGHRRGENVYSALGQTDAGRYLIAFFICKSDRKALVLSARDMSDSERKQYEQR